MDSEKDKSYIFKRLIGIFGEPKMKPSSQVNFRMDSDLKLELERRALTENKNLSDYLRDHIMEIKQQFPGRIIEEFVAGPVQMPYSQYPYTPYNPQSPYPYQIDPMTQMVQEMKQMWMAKMMADMITGRNSVESTYAAMRNPDGAKKDDFDMNSFMKYQMIQSQLERQSMVAQQQLASARAAGDKGSENQAAQLIAQIAALQTQQSQNFMQLLVGLQTANSQTQTTLFNTALATNKENTVEARQQQSELSQQIEGVRNQLFTAQMTSLSEMNKMQVDNLSREIERIRNDKSGDLMTQLQKIVELRKDPIYKAAFDVAWGIKEESAIGKLIPQLKELGMDKVAERILNFLGGMVARPKIPSPAEAAAIPPPLPITQPTQPLEQLKLPSFVPAATPTMPTGTMPPQPTQPPTYYVPPQTQQSRPLTETVPSVLPEAQIGYTNLSKPEAEETVTVEMPVTEETPQSPEPIETSATPTEPIETPVAEPSTSGEGKPFTVGRKKKPKA